MGIVLIKLRPPCRLRDAIKISKQINLLRLAGLGTPQQIINQHLGVNLLLDIERRRTHHQI